RDLPLAIVTGESYGIYYFVPVLMVCIVFGWVLSRLERRAVAFVSVLLLAYWVVAAFVSTPRTSLTFWDIRDPFGRFYLGFFACGWLSLPVTVAARVSPRWLAAAAGGIVVLLAVIGVPLSLPLRVVPWRLLYTLAVTGLLWQVSFTLPGMRLMSEAT